MLMWHPKTMPLTELEHSEAPKAISLGTFKRCSERGNWYVRVMRQGRRRWHPFGDPKNLPKPLRASLLILGLRP